MVLAGLAGELEWAEREASPTYRVLSACRARRYAEENVLCSKIDGANWATPRVTETVAGEAILGALAFQQGLTTHPHPALADAALREALRSVQRALDALGVMCAPVSRSAPGVGVRRRSR